MALLCSPLASLPSPSLSPFAASSVVQTFHRTDHLSRLPIKPICLSSTSTSHFAILSISKRGCLPIRAAASDGAGPASDGAEPPPPPVESKVEAVPVNKLPLESKLQERMEQKLKMKLAKKIRLRRKRLVRKRHLRKKGRWPPSKMKKLKNV